MVFVMFRNRPVVVKDFILIIYLFALQSSTCKRQKRYNFKLCSQDRYIQESLQEGDLPAPDSLQSSVKSLLKRQSPCLCNINIILAENSNSVLKCFPDKNYKKLSMEYDNAKGKIPQHNNYYVLNT